MKNKIDFIISVRDRDNTRIQRCINSFKDYANEIYVVDYNSKKPIKVKYVKTIRCKNKIWNKSHALNLGIKKCTSDYICTVDCDIMLNDKLLNSIIKNLNKNTVIFNTNVRRIDLKDISKDHDKMLSKSKLWFEKKSRGNIYSSANGGIQILPRKWINKVGGYDEGLGIYWGAMDNRVYEQAKGLGMTVIDLNIPMLHQEHKNTKESNLDKEEQEFAQKVRTFKIGYLNKLICDGDFISYRTWGGERPNHDWMMDLVKEWSTQVIFNRNYSETKVKVYISIITNYDRVPTYFMLDLIKIIGRAKHAGIEILLNNPKGNGVDAIRNISVIDAKNNGATHLLQLDIDHLFPEDLILRLLEHDKDFVCGTTSKRTSPYTQTQFKDASVELVGLKDNICKIKGDEGLIKIGASGMVGSLIKLDVFQKINYPFYKTEHKQIGNRLYDTGEDIYFCYDKETSIMTKEGPKLIKDITFKDLILTMNHKTLKMEYHCPLRIIKKFENKLLHFKSSRLDLMVTKDQDLLVGYKYKEKGIYHPLKFIKAEEMNKRLWDRQSRYYVKRNGGYWHGISSEQIEIGNLKFKTEDFCSFMGWYLSEGHTHYNKKKTDCLSNYSINISQNKEENINEIISIIKRIGFNPRKYKGKIVFYNKELWEYLHKFGYSYEKYIPEEILSLSKEYLEIFLESFRKGDGHLYKDGRITFYTSSKKLRNGIVECLLKCGKDIRLSEHENLGGGIIRGRKVNPGRKIYRINTNPKQYETTHLRKAKEVEYNDFTYDLTVPNNTLFVIRNGKGCWSSNCRQLLKAKIDIWCDTSLSYPHQVTNAFVDKGKMSIYT